MLSQMLTRTARTRLARGWFALVVTPLTVARFISDNYEYGEPLELAQWIAFAISFGETEKIKVEFGYTDKYPVEITIEEV